MPPISIIQQIMTDFAESTGLSEIDKNPRRYLWTDAFAVCNFIELYRLTKDEIWRQSALQLVDQVHATLGRHREDDPRSGWISGLSDKDADKHPTKGGLRIGKQLNERKPGVPYDDRMEWDRDGQYYHYLTKWMHALDLVSRSTRNPIFNIWAIELAKAAHAGFVHFTSNGSLRMYWKMSIDLAYPLVPSMGLHDPLDGLITYTQLQTTAEELSKIPAPNLDAEIKDMEALCKEKNWFTDDPLGIGGLLSDACRVAQLIAKFGDVEESLLKNLLDAILPGLESYAGNHQLTLPADYRLAFRELGLAIGLHVAEKIEDLLRKKPEAFAGSAPIDPQIEKIGRHCDLSEKIERFWLDPKNRQSASWTDHRDINEVMLATSLAPEGFLDLDLI